MINPNVIKPKGLMILALVALVAMAVVSYHWLTQPTLTPADVTFISGTLKEAREGGGKSPYLEIILADQPHPFRCFSELYPDDFKFDVHGRLGAGDPVTLGVATSEMGSPRRNWRQNQQYFKFVTMSIGGDEALPLDAHNREVAMNRRVAPWFFGVIALICVPLFWLGFRHRGSSEPILEILKARRKTKQAA